MDSRGASPRVGSGGSSRCGAQILELFSGPLHPPGCFQVVGEDRAQLDEEFDVESGVSQPRLG